MVAPALKTVGVEAVVEGLSKFVGDVGTMNRSIGSIGDEGNLLTRTLDAVGGAFSWLGDKIIDVATYALGQLLASAIQAILSKLADLIAGVMDAGAQFQLLELRLNRLNFNSVVSSADNYNQAMELATALTKDQLDWLQKLAVQTPYDFQDIANVYTLARSYGFAGDAAKDLTRDISDFAAGMSLGNTEISRIIINFGQLQQQGKVTQRELNDLARGAFVPVNDVLKIMQENVGLTGAEFEKFRYTGEGVQAFLGAFSELVETRFAGATRDMARTFKGATDNAQDFLKSLIGYNIVTPVLNEVGGAIADMINSLTAEGNWDRLNEAAARVGEGFRQILAIFQHIMGLNVSGFAEGLISGLNGIADWIANNRTEIYQFFVGIRDTIQDKVIPFITGKFIPALQKIGSWLVDHVDDAAAFFKAIIDNARKVGSWIQRNVITAFNAISEWVNKNRGLIDEFFSALGTIISTVIGNITGMDLEGGGLQGFLEGIGSFMQFVIDNQQSIATFVETLLKLWAVFQVISTVVSVLVGLFVAVVVPVLAFAAAAFSVWSIITLLLNPVGLLIVAIIALGATIAIFWQDAVVGFQYLGTVISEWWANVVLGFQYLGAVIAQWLADASLGFAYLGEFIALWATDAIMAIVNFVTGGDLKFQEFVSGAISLFTGFKNQFIELIKAIEKKVLDAPWGTIGREIIHGMSTGVIHAVQGLIDAVVGAIRAAIDAAYDALDAASPSKVFMELGAGTMEGMAIGIKKMAGLAKSSMETAIGDITMPAMMQQYALAPSTVSNQNSYTNNFNLSVNSQSQIEPILQDFNMMKSIIGA